LGKGKKLKQRTAHTERVEDTNYSDLNVQLFHPAHEEDHASTQLILAAGDERLAFNCGEGFQRMCTECSVRRLL
jgi:hypothetical protein